MSKLNWSPALLALALFIPSVAHAADDAALAEIREQIRQIKSDYEARIQALEERLKAAEDRATSVDTQTATAVTPQPPAPIQASTSGISAFNPAISAVLQGTYANLSRDPKRYALNGFAPSGDIAPGPRGFSLGESEFALSANIDDKFYGNLIVSLTPENTVSVEEAYGLYASAPYGLAPKFGRFFSGLGYLNEQHQHVWDFVDAPLAYQAFLGNQYDIDGLQLKWGAPIEQFLEFGVELGKGSGFPGNDRDKNGVGTTVAYVHTGGDIGFSNSWRTGISYLQTGARDRDYSQVDTMGRLAAVDFSGRSKLAVADFVWKYAPNGNAHDTNFKLQGEYFRRLENGDLIYNVDGTLGSPNASDYASRQSGWYLQGIYQFMPGWRIGTRYDRLDRGETNYGSNSANLSTMSMDPQRWTVMVDWTHSEFSRFRLQFQQAQLSPDVTDNELFLQYILTLGAHGAHKF